MMAYLGPVVHWVGDSHLAIYLRDIPWVWPLCETIHFIGLAMVVGVAGFFDLRLLGFFNRVPISACKEFMPWAMVGFALNLVSGTVFLIIFPGQYVYSPTWCSRCFSSSLQVQTPSSSRQRWQIVCWRCSRARRRRGRTRWPNRTTRTFSCSIATWPWSQRPLLPDASKSWK